MEKKNLNKFDMGFSEKKGTFKSLYLKAYTHKEKSCFTWFHLYKKIYFIEMSRFSGLTKLIK